MSVANLGPYNCSRINKERSIPELTPALEYRRLSTTNNLLLTRSTLRNLLVNSLKYFQCVVHLCPSNNPDSASKKLPVHTEQMLTPLEY
nr:hypothetical protein [Aquimarina macrocephali]